MLAWIAEKKTLVAANMTQTVEIKKLDLEDVCDN